MLLWFLLLSCAFIAIKANHNLALTLNSDNYIAGTNAGVIITAGGSQTSFDVKLDCGDGLQQIVNGFIANQTDFQNFTIPENFYGVNCVFSIVNYDTVEYDTPSAISGIDIYQQIYFASPVVTQSYPMNTPLTISPRANTTLPDNPVTVYQVCGQDSRQYDSIEVGFDFQATLPDNFYGYCTFSTNSTEHYAAAEPITIKISNLVLQVSPSSIPAGTSAGIKIMAAAGAQSFTVQLLCFAQQMKTIGSFIANLPDYQYFPIPKTFYGAPCTFSIIDYPGTYDQPDPVEVTVTQALTFESPKNGDLIYRLNPVPVYLKSGYLTTNFGNIEVTLDCGVYETSEPVVTNTIINVDYTADFVGDCTLSVTKAQDFFVIPAPLTITLKDKLVLVNVPSILLNGQTFTPQVDYFGPQDPNTLQVDLEMFCDKGGQVQLWTNQPVNQPLSLTIDPNLTNGPLHCQLRTIPTQSLAQASSKVTIYIILTPAEQKEFLSKIISTFGTRWA